jgi:hypothetical protein
MLTVTNTISRAELTKMAEKMYGNLVKAVVDIEKKIMIVDADLHADQEEMLLEQGSEQKNLWGINLHPDKIGGEGWIEFDSMINLRPSWGNKTRGVENPEIQKKIVVIVNTLVTR